MTTYFDNVVVYQSLKETWLAWTIIGFILFIMFLVLMILAATDNMNKPYSVITSILVGVYLLLSSTWFAGMYNKNKNDGVYNGKVTKTIN